MNNILKHIWNALLHPKWIFLIGVAIIGLGLAGYHLHKSGGGGKSALSPTSGPEGTQITLTYPAKITLHAGAYLKITDPDEHGYYPVKSGGGMYVSYDPTTGLTYKLPATQGDSTNPSEKTLSGVVPQDVCGLVIVSAQDAAAPPKVVNVSVVDANGNPVPGMPTAKFSLKCDKYTLSVKMTSSKDPVLPDGADFSTVTATFSVKGPAQYDNGVRLPAGSNKPVLTTPLGLMVVNVTTNFGTMVPPSPANVKTDLNGQVTVTLSSADAGIARVRATALGVGDAYVDVHFKPKITAVTMVFVQPQSPTNYQMSTIPKNAKDLTFDWKFIPAPGNNCGSLTGPASGLGESANGFYHGPSDGYPNGCPEAWEMASQMQVTVTDKDGQSDRKTFGARAFEGQGPVKL
ncbi:MAG: hypothetical protein KGJ89_02760 [Patescibacteria group bacterium]|nr:hypothetical protein [Patescibacteria group bacterium]MDE2015529.1 hypothetical protein [Patescibacteria group bacterium]MDE2226855.1 hypothetical protein [Patescibacteria group bacterium]